VTYDPRACGARCDECPLKGNTVVPPEANISPVKLLAGAGVAIVGEAPGEQEEKHERPFVGPSGAELDTALRMARIRRRETHITNVMLCRPPGNKLQDFLRKISRENKKREKEYKAKCKEAEQNNLPMPSPPKMTPTPMECCAPRLEAEIAGFRRFITLGKTAMTAVTGVTASIMAVRGGLMELDATERTPERKVMPTVHPAFVLRMPRWKHVFRNDVFKAGRWFRGEAEWVPPNVTYNPEPEELKEFLSNPDRIYTFDIETDGIESLTAKMRCIAIGDTEKVMVVGLLGKDGHTRFYPPVVERRVRRVLCDFFEDESKVKAGHNAGYYDKIVLQQQWGINPKPIVDTILLHRCVESELPHGLAYVGSMYTEAPSWKTDREGNKLSHGSESDEQLHEYCANDVAVTARVMPPLIDQVKLRKQVPVWQLDQRIQAVCSDMHTVGMFVDQKKRLAEEKRLLSRRYELLHEIRERLEIPDFNPGSIYQLRDVLFEDWQLVPPVDEEERYTASGDPSTADLVLRALLTSRDVAEEHRELIKLIRYYRKVQKVLGTYVVKLRPWNLAIEDHLGWDDDDDWVDKETRKKYGLEKRGIVDPRTGRMHPGYNAHVAVTGRLSSSKPINAQNFPKAMRSMVVAAPGNVLVGADMDQLELRIAAARWGVQLYLRAFETGKDPHSMTAFAVFGERFCRAAGITPDQFDRPGPLVGPSYINGKFEGSGEDKKMRDLSKAVQYASQYMAKVETVHKLICKTEIPSKSGDGTTDLPYALLPLRRVRQMRDNWLKGAPEFERGWDKEITTYRNTGFIREDVTGRRRDFLDGEMPNEIVNFPIQSSAAGLMNQAILVLHEQIPLNKWGPGTGIINQCHDSIVVECPESEAPKVAAMLEEAMNQTHPDLPGVTFTASAGVGKTWKEVG
jgi:DNA polymerase-1